VESLFEKVVWAMEWISRALRVVRALDEQWLGELKASAVCQAKGIGLQQKEAQVLELGSSVISELVSEGQ
jgi:hypothetical protein